MGRAARILAAVASLLAAAAIAVVVLLPRLVDRPELRAQIEAAAHEATGRTLVYDSLAARILPPEIEVVKPALADDVAGEPPPFAADRVALRLALLPLLARRIVIDRLRVEKGSLRLEDATVSPPFTLLLQDVSLVARATAPEAPLQLEGKAELASGGEVALRGTITVAGELDAAATLSKVELKPLCAYLGRVGSVAGQVGGTLHATGPLTAPAAIDARLVSDAAAVEIDPVRLRGKLSLAFQLARREGALGGPFEIDASEAELAYGDSFHKPAGTAATTSGTLTARPGGGFDVEGVHVKIKNFQGHGSLHGGTRR